MDMRATNKNNAAYLSQGKNRLSTRRSSVHNNSIFDCSKILAWRYSWRKWSSLLRYSRWRIKVRTSHTTKIQMNNRRQLDSAWKYGLGRTTKNGMLAINNSNP